MAGGTQGTGQMNFQVPEEMRTMAERSVTQTRQALESFLQAARRTAETMEQTTEKVQASSKDMAQRTLSAAEQNIRTSLDYAERLVRARDVQEMVQIQSDFARTQTEAMQTQMKEYGSGMQSAMDTAKGIAQSAVEAMKGVVQTVADTATHAKDKAAATDSKDKGTKKQVDLDAYGGRRRSGGGLRTVPRFSARESASSR
jgi:phasin